jgi:predicted amidophosphoribosyltransferase
MTEKKEPIYCPYCDVEITEVNLPLCRACGITIFYCPKCRKPLQRENRVCPYCGADIREEATKEG